MKILFLTAALLASPTHAAEQRIECPARYPVEDIKLPETGKGDTGFVMGQLPLEGGGMATGPLAQRAELRGSERKIKSGFETRFGFNRHEDPPEKWFLCYYGAGGSVRLARRVADTTTACTLTHEKKKFPLDPRIEINCR